MNDDATWRGRVIDARYRVDGVLGSGGMGVVLRAHHEFTGASVAVKLLREEFTRDPQVQQRFLAEARASNQIGHPGIVQVLDAGRDPTGALYLVMELLAGESLREPMRRRELRGPEIARIGSELAAALGAAHERGFVHRDLKPENVFLVAPSASVKLLDFGIAKVAAVGAITATGALLGTPAYMAPEQLTNAAAVDARADLWALGVILYELVSGQLPFAGSTIHEMLAQIAIAEPRPITGVLANVPPAVAAFFARAVARDPARRFASTGEMAAALAPLPLGGIVAASAPLPAVVNSAPPIASIAVGATQAPNAPPVALPVASQAASWVADSRAAAAPAPAAPMPAATPAPMRSNRGVVIGLVIGGALSVAIGAVVAAVIATHGGGHDPDANLAVAKIASDAAQPSPTPQPVPTPQPAPTKPPRTFTPDHPAPPPSSPADTPFATCKQRCAAARACGVADTTCEHQCESNERFVGCMSENWGKDCNTFASCEFVFGCGAEPSGSLSCNQALTGQAKNCAVGDAACGCRWAMQMSRARSAALMRVDGCVMVSCFGSKDPSCPASKCGAYIAQCASQ